MFYIFTYLFTYQIFISTKKWYFNVLVSSFILIIILFFIGFGIWFLGSPIEGLYKVDEVSVIDVRNNKILVDCSKYYNGENKIIKIHKPFFVKVKEDDVIHVKYPINHIEKMHYVIDSKVGEKIFSFCFILGVITFFVTIIIAIICKGINS